MNCLKTTVILASCLFLLTCGIDEYYYLPKVPDSGVVTQSNTNAEVYIPSGLLNQVDHYATGYVIFYRIYISNLELNTVSDILNYTSSKIYSDYNSLLRYTDPSETTYITSLTTFSGKGFYELELEGIDIKSTVLSKSGGTFNIQFPTRPGDWPNIEYNENEYSLLRSNGLKEGGTPFNPVPEDRYFFNSDDLRNYANAIPTINADVAGQQNDVNEQTNAYASMYIVAVGQNPTTFSKLYGKPTHISIFKLPSLY